MWDEGEEPPRTELYSNSLGCTFAAALVFLLAFGLYSLIF
jgi:hypothetical protein